MRLPGVDRPGTEEAGHPPAHPAHCTLHIMHGTHSVYPPYSLYVHGCVIEYRSMQSRRLSGLRGGAAGEPCAGGGENEAAMRKTSEGVGVY